MSSPPPAPDRAQPPDPLREISELLAEASGERDGYRSECVRLRAERDDARRRLSDALAVVARLSGCGVG